MKVATDLHDEGSITSTRTMLGCEFDITAVRRCQGERVDEADLELRLGLRIARLAAEAPESSRFWIEMTAPRGELCVSGRVQARPIHPRSPRLR